VVPTELPGDVIPNGREIPHVVLGLNPRASFHFGVAFDNPLACGKKECVRDRFLMIPVWKIRFAPGNDLDFDAFKF